METISTGSLSPSYCYCLVYHLVVTTSSTLHTHFIFSAMNSRVHTLSFPPPVPSISWKHSLLLGSFIWNSIKTV